MLGAFGVEHNHRAEEAVLLQASPHLVLVAFDGLPHRTPPPVVRDADP
jgi:hypothetical protein